jgi:HK97 family phage prohead protease
MSDKRFAAAVTLKALGGEGDVEAVFSTQSIIDSDGDRVLSSAFQDGQAVPMVWAHDWSKPIGRGVVRVEPSRAVFGGRFFTETQEGRERYLTVKALGDLQEWSFGFAPGDTEPGPTGERVIKALTLFEVSPVLIGANRMTRTLAIKRAAPVADPLRAELLAMRARFLRDYRPGPAVSRAELIELRNRCYARVLEARYGHGGRR